jgi:predicted nucleic acid-binding protein
VTLADSNVLLDLITNDPVWRDWSEQQLTAAAITGDLAINEVVFAELSVRFARIEELDLQLERTGAYLIRTPPEALFLAGKAFGRYRARGGQRPGVLPDFFIGAHAAVANAPLITRDTQRYRFYFPGIELITPSVN